MKQPFHAELMEALGETGCGLCRLGARTVTRYLDILAYENVNDVALRETIRDGLGLCNRHAWQFVDETRAPLGTAIIYRDLIRTLQQRTPEAVGPADEPARRLRGLLPARPCVACAALAVSIQDCAHQFLQSWSDRPFRAAFDRSEGLCWPHLLVTLNADRFARRWHGILAAQRGGWDRRISRALRDRSAAPLLECLSSAPRLNGTQIGPSSAGAVPESGSRMDPVCEVSGGMCPVCATMERWLVSLTPWPPPPGRGGGGTEIPLSPGGRVRGGEGSPSPLSPGGRGAGGEGAGLLCAVHAWHAARARNADALDRLVDRVRALDERLTRGIELDLRGSLVLRVAERIRRGSSLPPDVTIGLDCPLCPEQLGQEAGVVEGLESATLCVPHLRVAAFHSRSFGGLLRETRRTWRTIEGQLDEVIRKYDYRFTREPRGEEQTSPRWAVALVAGANGVR